MTTETELLNGVPLSFGAGLYNIQVTAGTGSYSLSYSVNGKAPRPITESTEESFNINLPACDLIADITGTITIAVNKIS